MPAIRSFAEAHERLRAFYNRPGSNTYTLDRMRALMEYLGNPQDQLRIVHVAGTSGKTSTAYYAAALLEAAGAKVGLTVGPHVDEVNERVQINHTPLSEAVFRKALDEFMTIVAASDARPSYFELLVAFAFWQFAQRGVDYAVVEVGLGGLLDGTNVISRADKICIITDIGLDHTEILGNTISKIAEQKAGIIQPQNHVFMYEQSSEVMHVVRTACDRAEAKLHEILPTEPDEISRHLPLFQQRNFYLARRTVEHVLQRDGRLALTQRQLRTAADVTIPGRMQVYRLRDKVVIFDGAHNEQKMAALTESVRAAFPNRPIAALAAFVETKSDRWQPTLAKLASVADHVVVTSFNTEPTTLSKRSVDPNTLARSLEPGRVTTEPSLAAACRILLARSEPILLVTGSLYMLSDARKYIV